jgi:predicted hydrocarbon binding protein
MDIKTASTSNSPTEEMITNISMRAELEAINEIMGRNACKILYREAGLSRILDTPPEYDFSPCVSKEEGCRLDNAILNLLGLNAAVVIWRRVGYRAIQSGSEIGHLYDQVKDLPPKEKFLESLELYRLAIGAGRIVENGSGLVEFERPECLHCRDIESSRPVCSLTEGVLEYIAEISFGKDVYRARETKCKAMGDDTCYYVLEKRE